VASGFSHSVKGPGSGLEPPERGFQKTFGRVGGGGGRGGGSRKENLLGEGKCVLDIIALFLFVTINKDIISDFKKKVARERQRTFYSPWTLPSGYILSQLLPCLPPHPHAHMCEHTCIRIGTGGPSEVRGYSRLRLSFRPSQYCVWHLLAGQFQ
jgi:hypothetical protein